MNIILSFLHMGEMQASVLGVGAWGTIHYSGTNALSTLGEPRGILYLSSHWEIRTVFSDHTGCDES